MLVKKFAHELLEKYSEEELLRILNERPRELLDFKGIKEKKLETIVLLGKNFKHLRELRFFLGKFGVTSNLITKYIQVLVKLKILIEKIKENPYIFNKYKRNRI